MRRKRIVKQIGCAVLAGALMVGQIFGSGASLITAKAADFCMFICCRNGRKHTGSTPADDYYLSHIKLHPDSLINMFIFIHRVPY